MRVVVSRSQYESRHPYDLLGATTCFVAEMLAAEYRPAELPEWAVRLYCVDYYVAQVCNGGHSQFFYNVHRAVLGSPAEPVVLAHEGLRLIGARRVAAVLERSVKAWSGKPARALALLESFFFDAPPDARRGFSRMDREFYREKYDDEVYARADAWIRSEADLEIIELALIAARFAELASQVPDRVSRLEAAAREAEARRDPRERTIENECKRRGLVFERSTALSPRKDGLGWEWHFVASGRHFYALDPEAGVRLFDGTTGEPLD